MYSAEVFPCSPLSAISLRRICSISAGVYIAAFSSRAALRIISFFAGDLVGVAFVWVIGDSPVFSSSCVCDLHRDWAWVSCAAAVAARPADLEAGGDNGPHCDYVLREYWRRNVRRYRWRRNRGNACKRG